METNNVFYYGKIFKMSTTTKTQLYKRKLLKKRNKTKQNIRKKIKRKKKITKTAFTFPPLSTQILKSYTYTAAITTELTHSQYILCSVWIISI